MRAAVLVLALAACGGHKDAGRAASGHDAAVVLAHDVTMTAGSHGGVLELTFRNVTTAPIEHFATHVFGGALPNYDWLTVTVDGRRIAFVGDRDESGIADVTLAPGEDKVIRIDLAEWTDLARGVHPTTVVWDTTREPDRYWRGRLEAQLALTI